jgi:signal transduction histidine kinase
MTVGFAGAERIGGVLNKLRGLFRLKLLFAVMVALCTIVAAAVGALLILTDLAESVAQTDATTRDLALLLEGQISRTSDGAERVATRVASQIAAAGGTRAVAASPALRTAIGVMAEATPSVRNIVIYDAGGRVVFDASGALPAGSASASDAVASVLSGAKTVDINTLPQGSDDIAIGLARPITAADGSRLGAVAVAYDPGFLTRFYSSLTAGQNPSVGVYRRDGKVLMRLPPQPSVGRITSLGADPLFTVYLASAPQGTYRHTSPFDGTNRVVSYRSLDARQLVVTVGVGESESLGPWRRRALRTAAVLVAVVVLTSLLSWLLARVVGRQRHAAEELARRTIDLENSNADLQQFAYIASHDLKEPLRNIASYVQLLQRRYQGKLDADADAFIGYTVEGVRRLQSIIEELLAYSRIGTARPALAAVQSGAAVSAALSALKHTIAEAQAVVEISGPLPTVEADGHQLISLFQNLIGNGLKYRREEVRPEVQIACKDGGKEWVFSVRDNGIGIEGRYHAQIFEVFKRLHTRQRYSGTGIGLAICKRVVERHGGRIWVESEPHVGSTFLFTLPKLAG